MKKLALLILIGAAVGLGAKSIKLKVAELRQALAEHAKSEIDSWTLLQNLDKRMSKLERKKAYHQYENDQYDTEEK